MRSTVMIPALVALVLLASLPLIFRKSTYPSIQGPALEQLVGMMRDLREEWSDAGISIPFLRLLGPDRLPPPVSIPGPEAEPH